MESSSHHHTDDEISLKELFGVLWRDKWLIISITTLCTVAAGIAAISVPQKYRASVIVSPVSDSSGRQLSSLGGLASQFGGLASLAGLSVGGDSKKAESIAILQSQALTEAYIRDNHLLPVLYEKLWDAKGNKWTVTDPVKVPTLWKANDMFKKTIRSVATDTKTGLVTLTITWTDPKQAARWANDLVRLANDYQRNKAIAESERNIKYLKAEAEKATIVEAKQAIYAILQTEINKAMLARGSDEYAFRSIDPAMPPEKVTSPQKLLWIVAGLFAGAFLSIFIAIVRNAWR